MKLLLPVVLIAALAIGLMTTGILYLDSLSTRRTSTQTSNSETGSSNQLPPKVGDFEPYACAKPAIVSDLECDTLSPGYVILPRLPNAPSPVRPQYMTESAWQLLQKTFGNGVCDPNETWLTAPLDCAASGNSVNDPYTGRPGLAASVCQLGERPAG